MGLQGRHPESLNAVFGLTLMDKGLRAAFHRAKYGSTKEYIFIYIGIPTMM